MLTHGRKKMYKNIGRGSDDFGGVQAAGFNQAVCKHNRKVNLGCLMVKYESLEKEIPRPCFVLPLLVGKSTCQKTNSHKQIQTGKKIDSVDVHEITNIYDKATSDCQGGNHNFNINSNAQQIM